MLKVDLQRIRTLQPAGHTGQSRMRLHLVALSNVKADQTGNDQTDEPDTHLLATLQKDISHKHWDRGGHWASPESTQWLGRKTGVATGALARPRAERTRLTPRWTEARVSTLDGNAGSTAPPVPPRGLEMLLMGVVDQPRRVWRNEAKWNDCRIVR